MYRNLLCALNTIRKIFSFAAKLVPVGYGIKKLQIGTVVEDDKVSTDDLEEQICAFEDYVSCGIMSKISSFHFSNISVAGDPTAYLWMLAL